MFNAAKLKFDDIFENRLSQEEVREYLLELYERGETAAEIAGAASAMRDHVIPLPIHEDLRAKAIDVVGTGGDKSYSFNISSTVSILLASCGCYVAKHGNRSVTSKSGSADMLEHKVVFINDQAIKKAKEVKIGDIIEIRYLEKTEKFKVLQIPTTKSTPKSKIEEYVQRID